MSSLARLLQSAPFEAAVDLSDLPKLLTADEVAELLRTSRGAVYKLKERGNLHPIKLGSRLLFSRDAIQNYLGGK